MDNLKDTYSLARAKQEVSPHTVAETSPAAVALLVSLEPRVHKTIAEILAIRGVGCVRAGSIAEMKSISSLRHISVCVSGLWMVDGTFRDVVSHLRNRPSPVRVVIVCGADTPPEYREFLRALDIHCFDSVCYPFQKSDLERALESANGKSGEVKTLEATQSARPLSHDAHMA